MRLAGKKSRHDEQAEWLRERNPPVLPEKLYPRVTMM
jgi:hypothetical protein